MKQLATRTNKPAAGRLTHKLLALTLGLFGLALALALSLPAAASTSTGDLGRVGQNPDGRAYPDSRCCSG
jgi:hypothetical protein